MTIVKPGAFYTIHSKQRPDLLLDVDGESMADSAQVILYTATERYNQQWTFEPVDGSNDRYVIVARHSGLCMDVAGAATGDSVGVIQYKKKNGKNQQWDLKADAAGTVTLTAVHSLKVLDADGGASPSTHLIQFHPTGGLNQQWTLRPV